MELASVVEGGGRTRRGAEDEAAESRGHYPHISLKADRQVRPLNHLQHHLDHHPEQTALRLLIDATLKNLQKRRGASWTRWNSFNATHVWILGEAATWHRREIHAKPQTKTAATCKRGTKRQEKWCHGINGNTDEKWHVMWFLYLFWWLFLSDELLPTVSVSRR